MLNVRLRYIGLAALAVIVFSLAWGTQTWAQDGNDDPEQLGAQIYAENCAVCHGLNGEGRVGATLSKDWPSIRPDLASRATIAEGIPGSPMPAWSQENGGPLTDEEIDAVVNYILSWQTGGAPEITPGPTITSRPALSPIPEVAGNPNQGAVLYDQNCKVCHGATGEGRIGATLAKTWPAIRPDLTIKNTIINGIDGSPMLAWSQENGGPLSEAEINDIVAFVLSWEASAAESPQPTPEPAPASWMTGFGGVLLFLGLFILLIAGILLAQRAQKNSTP